MAPLRILHVTPYSAEAWAYGGIARLVGTLAHGLAVRGHHVTVCATDVCDATSRLAGTSASPSRLQAWPPQSTAGGAVLRVFPNISNRLAYHYQAFAPLGLSRFLKHHAGAFDVAHLHACRNFPGAIAARQLRRHGVPYVLAPNGTAPLLERRRVAKRVFDVLFGRRVIAHAARVLAVSDAECRQLHDLGVDRATVARIPNPVDLTEFAVPTPTGRFRQSLGIDGPIVLFLGKITPRKRLDVVVRAYAALGRHDATLVIAGNDMGGADHARALARALGVGDRTVFTGLLTGQHRLHALADADLAVYPSEHEIFGLVPLEAILSGTPVVVADDSGCADVVRGCGGGLVVPVGDHAGLADAMAQLLAHNLEWRAAATVAAAQVRHRYGAPRICEALERLYGEMVA